MTEIPEPIHTLTGLIDKAHEERQGKPRPHLGGSMIGHKCDRWLWLSFRWAVVEQFPGRILRLFRRGHHEEKWIVEDLKAAGVEVIEVDQTTGRQFLIKDGHFGGSLDGVAVSGIPEAPDKPHVLEFKTHALKSFDDLCKKGVKESKPMHYAQMQVYMDGVDVDRALYLAVCKNDDRIYTERVKLVKSEAKALNDRAQRIIASDRMPEPLSADPTWYECKFCAAHSFCHGGEPSRQVNCRTCAHSTAERDGRWTCARWDADIPSVDAQRAGCDDHVPNPDLVPWKMIDGDGVAATYEIEGQPVKVGHGGKHSKELLNAS